MAFYFYISWGVDNILNIIIFLLKVKIKKTGIFKLDYVHAQ